jgi:arylsulfatase A-like enzyme
MGSTIRTWPNHKRLATSMVLILIFTLLSAATGWSQAPIAEAAAAPLNQNVLLILLDDLDYLTLQRLIDAGKLPNIKANLYDKGVNFTNAYVTNALCCPSRASIYTGMYPHNHNLWSVSGDNNEPYKSGWFWYRNSALYQKAINAALQDQGYFTGFVGKFMNGVGHGEAPPSDFKWTTFSPLGGIYGYWVYQYRYWKWNYSTGYTGAEVIPGNNAYQTDQLAWEAKNAITSAQLKPFFVVYAPTVPHVEPDIDANPTTRDTTLNRPSTAVSNLSATAAFDTYTDTWSQHIRGRLTTSTIPGPISFSSTSPSSVSDSPRMLRQWSVDHWEPISAAFNLPRAGVSVNGQPVIGENLAASSKPFWLQQGFGNTRNPTNGAYAAAAARPSIGSADINRLKRLHLSRQEAMMALDDSLGYLFTQMQNQGKLANTLIMLTSDNGYQLGEHNLGQKIFPYEESIRVPLIIRDPYNLNASATPRTEASMVLNTDIAPTIAQFTKGWTIGWPGGSPDGRSLMPFISASYGTSFRRNRALIQHRAVVPEYTWNIGGKYMPFWQAPDYEALRTQSSTENSLYARYAYYRDMYPAQYQLGKFPTFSSTTVPVEAEFVNMATDPYQMTPQLGQKPQFDVWLNNLKSCRGSTCAAFEDAAIQNVHSYWNYDASTSVPPWWSDNGADLTSVSRYASGPCVGKAIGACRFDTRTMPTALVNGVNTPIESITAYGKYWNFDTNTGQQPAGWSGNGNDLTSVARYANGPCLGKPAGSCTFDTRTFNTALVNGVNTQIESITAYGKYWNFDTNTGQQPAGWSGNGNDLTSVARYANGSCLGKPAGSCKFDTRTYFNTVVNGVNARVEAITAYGKYWNFDTSTGQQPAGWSGNGSYLTTVPRYANGPCFGKAADACVFDTRTFTIVGGQYLESITN